MRWVWPTNLGLPERFWWGVYFSGTGIEGRGGTALLDEGAGLPQSGGGDVLKVGAGVGVQREVAGAVEDDEAGDLEVERVGDILAGGSSGVSCHEVSLVVGRAGRVHPEEPGCQIAKESKGKRGWTRRPVEPRRVGKPVIALSPARQPAAPVAPHM